MRPLPESRHLPGHPPGAAGASLTGLLVVLAITGVVTTGLYAFSPSTSQAYSDQAVVVRMLQSARTAMTRIAQDIRTAGTFWSMPCALEPLATAANGPPGRIEIRLMLDGPAAFIAARRASSASKKSATGSLPLRPLTASMASATLASPSGEIALAHRSSHLTHEKLPKAPTKLKGIPSPSHTPFRPARVRRLSVSAAVA